MSETLDMLLQDVCSSSTNALKMSAALSLLLREYFSDSNNIHAESLKNNLWTNEPSTGIYIEIASIWEPVAEDRRPAIIISRGEYKLPKIAMSDHIASTALGNKTHIRVWTGGSKVICLSRSAIEAEILADEVFRFFMTHSHNIRSRFGLLAFDPVTVSELSRAKKLNNYYEIVISIMYSWSESWFLLKDDNLLQDINISL